MGNPKQKWTPEEEDALRKGIEKHGAGKWKNIQKDPDFNHLLYSRSNIDLKDKWRNLSVANGQGSREKSRTPKLKPDTEDANSIAPIVPMPIDISHVPAPSVKEIQDDKTTSEVKNPLQFIDWILDAISALNDPNGSDTRVILGCIKENHVLPVNFNKMLSTRLKMLVTRGQIVKGPNGFRMKDSVIALPRPKPPISVPVVLKPVPTPNISDALEEAASDAAYRIAEAENKSFVASEAAKEAERVTKLVEECESGLLLAKEFFERCSRGEIVLIA